MNKPDHTALFHGYQKALSPEHVKHLEQAVTGGLLRPVMPDEVRDHLVKHGLLVQKVGGDVPTDHGLMFVTMKGRS